jgi:hypothetical protein
MQFSDISITNLLSVGGNEKSFGNVIDGFERLKQDIGSALISMGWT